MMSTNKKLTQRSYTATEALFITKQVELIDKKKSAKIILDENFDTFIVYIAALEALPEITEMTIYFSQIM